MKALNKQALREAANAANIASWGKWESYKPHKGARGYEVKVSAKAVAQHCLKVDSAFIAAANPSTVLALMDALEAAEKRIAELEARTITVKFEPIPMEELGNRRDGKKHPYMFGAGYNSAVVHCESVLHQACAAAGIGVKGE
ncbi:MULTISPECIES: ead/Ea22-like family protein [Enterobacteriaceae]|uniref:ead/Ea22-like family protein n=1 Tax=Enterobacteriaceae TaxID=543 RepID=UPI00244836A2|nr:ead/Ea22-like family protein [Enterobacter roggenkampii]MDG9877879.1 ead/Ea22-like family protein [Enterobacter roggenkampii]